MIKLWLLFQIRSLSKSMKNHSTGEGSRLLSILCVTYEGYLENDAKKRNRK